MSKIDEYRQRYIAAAHAMQTGVAFMMNHTDETEPKHLRVGVNSAMVQHGALVHLLIQKGIITEEEWWKTLAECMEEEANDYAKKIEARLGVASGGVSLG